MSDLAKLLSEGLVERWYFPANPGIESAKIFFDNEVRDNTSAHSLLSKAKRIAKQIHEVKQKITTTNLCEGASSTNAKELKPLLFWLLCAENPVSLMFTKTGDKLHDSVRVLMDYRASEIVSKVYKTPKETITNAGMGAIKNKRLKDISIAIHRLRTQDCNAQDRDRWAAVAACLVLRVGLVVSDNVFPDVVCWGPKVAWITPEGDFICMTESESREELRRMAVDLISRPLPDMNSLRRACFSLSVAKPLNRTRVGLIQNIISSCSLN